jgi:DNA-binding transcriptional LysR family regulator
LVFTETRVQVIRLVTESHSAFLQRARRLMHKGNWDDLRFVLAVAEGGTVSAAARVLGVNHATVLRRVAAFEAAQGVPIFDRTAQGYVVLPDRLRVIEAAREAAQAMDTVARLIKGAEVQLSGSIRITSTDTFCLHVLPEIIPGLVRGADHLSIELICSNLHLDLGRLGADIAIRPALTLPEEMAGERAGVLGFAAYSNPQASATTWLALRGALARARATTWLETEIPASHIIGGADSFVVLRELAAAGQGIAILPCCLGDTDSRLTRLSDAMPHMTVPIWVASHADLATTPRLRSMRARLVTALHGKAALLAGTDAA